MNRLFFVVLGLAAVGILAVSPVDATTATATPMPTANESSTNGTISTVEVIDLIEDSGTWSEEQARDVYEWVRRGDLDALPEEQTRELYRRLLKRAAQRGSVPDDVLERATGAVEDPEAIVEDLAGEIPEEDLRDLAEDLDGAGAWAEGIAVEAIHAIAAGASTPEPSTATPVIGAGNASTVYADLGTVEVTAWEFTDGEMRVTLKAATPTDVVITDAMGIVSEGVTTLNRRRVTIRGRRVVRMDVTQVDDAAAVTVATRNGAVSISTGVEDNNPFRYFGGTSGLFSGVMLSIGLSIGATSFVLWREETGVIQA